MTGEGDNPHRPLGGGEFSPMNIAHSSFEAEAV